MSEVGCAGILVADMFCGPMRALPEPGQLMVLDGFPMRLGGCAWNVALALARQGVGVDVCGCVGRDAQAHVVLDALRGAGLGCDQIVRTDAEPTSATVILLIEGQDRRFIHVFGANKCFQVEQIDRRWLADLKVFYLGGLFLMPGIVIEQLSELLQFCKERGILTVVDVAVPEGFEPGKHFDALAGHIDYFLPNDDEAAQITGESDPRRQVRALLDRGVGTAIITRGDQGLIAAADKTLYQSGVFATEVVDPSGAGDAFTAGVITGALRGWDVPAMLSYASALGASCTRKVGCTDGVFTGADAEAFLKANELGVREE